MLQMIYLSQARAEMPDQEIGDILAVSRRNNGAEGLTGLLIYGGGFFMQLLEGPEAALFKRYARILGDPRHKDCKVIAISPCEERLFGNWSMGCVPTARLWFDDIAALREHRRQAVTAPELRGIMRRFHDRLVQTSKTAPAG